jgi:hypothetical protein
MAYIPPRNTYMLTKPNGHLVRFMSASRYRTKRPLIERNAVLRGLCFSVVTRAEAVACLANTPV